MKQIADLHIHSRYSMATSKDGTPEMLDLWARKKGITLLGTGDMTHPIWRQELKAKLIPAEQGLFRLKDEYVLPEASRYPEKAPRFVLSGEISSIYKKGGKTRKVHSLILLPGFNEADAFAARLEKIGNIHSDGRPILGLPCHDLLEIMLEVSEEGMYIPAHIWTPHFSLFGAKSGFDTIEECFEDLTPYIHALETGLSSDPVMNWQISALDGYQLVSHSDAHSPSKLGREANLMEIEMSYGGLEKAIQLIAELKEEFYKDLRVVGEFTAMNNELEKAARVADFIELANLMAHDALDRNESCGGHCRLESVTEEGEAKRDDAHYTYVSVWEYKGEDKAPELHKENLVFENVELTQRSYK